MGKIVKTGVEYAGGGRGGQTYSAGQGIKISSNNVISIENPTAKQVELTQAEYDALTEEQKTDGTIYFITDGEGGGGGGAFSSDFTVTNSIGRYRENDVIEKDTPIENVIRGMLTKVYYPTTVRPSFSIGYTTFTSFVKLGSSLPAGRLTSNFDKGSIMLNGVKQNDAVGEVTEYWVYSTGADTEIDEKNTTGTFDLPAITRSTRGKVYLSGRVSFTEGPQPKDSEGRDYGEPYHPGKITTTINPAIEFVLPFYWGNSSSATISDFTGLTEFLYSKGPRIVTYSTNNEYMVFAYDSTYGDLVSILDPNNFETIDGWNKSVLTVDGWEYNVYVSGNPTTDPSAKYTFKF